MSISKFREIHTKTFYMVCWRQSLQKFLKGKLNEGTRKELAKTSYLGSWWKALWLPPGSAGGKRSVSSCCWMRWYSLREAGITSPRQIHDILRWHVAPGLLKSQAAHTVSSTYGKKKMWCQSWDPLLVKISQKYTHSPLFIPAIRHKSEPNSQPPW